MGVRGMIKRKTDKIIKLIPINLRLYEIPKKKNGTLWKYSTPEESTVEETE